MKKGIAAIAATTVATLIGFGAAAYAGSTTEKYGGVRQEAVSTDCNAANECFIQFNAADTELQIKKVSCNFFLKAPASNNIQILGTELLRSSGKKQFQAQHLVINFQNGYGATFTQYQFLADVLWGMPLNWRPTIHVWYSQSVDAHFDCTISGPIAG